MRFTSKDPVAGTKLDPSTQNPYSYVGGNPLSNADPTGMDWWNNWNDFVNAVEGVSNEIQGWFAQANDYIESKSGRRPLTWEEYCGHACEEFPGLREYGWPTLLVTTSLIAPEGWGFYSIDIGEAGEINFQDLLAGEGLQTERGLWMNAETGEIIKTDAILKRPWVQMDLYSYEYRWLIDTKVGYQSGTETLEEAQWQSKLLSKGYLRGISWVSLPNSLGKMGWSANLASKLLWTYGIKTWKIPYP
jgi:hypothetical protein